MKALCRIVAGALLIGGGMSAAFADSLVSAKLSVQLTLVDLDPLDDVTPWITFQDSSQTFRGALFTMKNDEESNGHYLTWAKAFSPFVGEVSSDRAWAKASFAVDASGMGGLHLADSYAAYDGARQMGLVQIFGAWNQFTLSEKTSLVITATSSATAEVTHSWSGSDELNKERADAGNFIGVSGPAADGLGTGTQQASLFHEMGVSSSVVWNAANGSFDFAPASKSETKEFSGSFTNLSGAAMSGTISMYAGATSRTPGLSPPVPEVGSGWLMLVGLMATCYARRRRVVA